MEFTTIIWQTLGANRLYIDKDIYILEIIYLVTEKTPAERGRKEVEELQKQRANSAFV